MAKIKNYDIIPLRGTNSKGLYETPTGEIVKAEVIPEGLGMFESSDLERVCAWSICSGVGEILNKKGLLHPSDSRLRFGFIDEVEAVNSSGGGEMRAVQLYQILDK